MIAVTRRYRFAAAHILRQPALSQQENERLYGQCANPNGHGHDYVVEVTVTGPLHEETGWIVPPQRLDAIVQESALERLGHRLLNEDAWFQSRVPTAENVVLRLREQIDSALATQGEARVVRVRLRETRRNTFECGEV